MAFPTASSIPVRNEDGEIIGWESSADNAPDAEFDLLFDDYYNNNREPLDPKDTAQCIQWGIHALDADGIEGEDNVYQCCYCPGRFREDDDGTITNL